VYLNRISKKINMKKIDASKLNWLLMGWRPFHWRLRWSMELGIALKSDVNPFPVKLPSSVQGALKETEILPDWNMGMQSRECEWVEHRHWEFLTEIPEGYFGDQKMIKLVAEGLDYSGWILVDGKEVADFSGALVPHVFDLSDSLGDQKKHYLSIVFDEPPAEQGQVGYTSQSKYFKPRFSYSWDWCPRFVPIGISDELFFEIGPKTIEIEGVRSVLNPDNRTGYVQVILNKIGPADRVIFRLSLRGKVVWESHELLTTDRKDWSLDGFDVEAWWPNGLGNHSVYDLDILVQASSGIVQIEHYAIGFKRVEWEPCQGASNDAFPWICKVNGTPIFLQGVNWTPIRMDYAAISESDYRQRIDLYTDMGCNVLRVWGGAYLEKKIFYQLCDEAGLLVWQEFPLSSSGVDNWAPENPEVIQTLCNIAKSYIHRRGHYVSKLLWCGGNELQSEAGKKTGCGVPLDFSHPCLQALKEVVEREDPGVCFLPCSASGPRFCADSKDFGKKLHHDVHGPWQMEGKIEQWEDYWRSDDALLRSEVGLPGASDVVLVDRYRGTCDPWPPSNENTYWNHANSWWIQWDVFKDQLIGATQQEKYVHYVELSQNLQARGLALAAWYCKARFPRCGGFIIWMGHDAFPCLSNTAIIDFDGNPKPAYYALKNIFLRTVNEITRKPVEMLQVCPDQPRDVVIRI
jgi:beta-mannosidase